jgi:mannose/fructose/N-acetylgalactosamine-specific phosphotransferase system component IIC
MIPGDGITATYTSVATPTTIVGVYSSGPDAITATLSDPGSKLGNYTLTQNLGTLTVTQATTALTWATPAAITYGTPLSATQLDATSGGVAGTFVYTPAAGAVLAAGTQTLSVTFTPTDSADYSVATLTVSLTVNKAPLTVTPNNAFRLYGVANPAFTGSITGLVAGDTVTATYVSAANLTTVVGVYSSGANAIAATLSDPGSKLGNYTLTQNVGTLTITQTTTTLTWPTPAAITYGTPLSATQLDATSGGIAGTFVYTPATGTILTAGSQTLSVVFTPTDGADYSTATTTVLLTVNKASLTVTPNPSSKVYGTANPALTGSITGLVTGDTITATYASAATTSTAIGVYSLGANAIAATLSDPGSRLGNYTVTQNLGTLTITQATTILTWPTPAAITYGTPLSATQLDATSGGVAGTFGYSPVAGTVLAAGPQTLSVTFTPNDTADYSVATLTVALTVNKAPLTVSPNSASRLYGVANPVFTGSIIGLVAGDTITATYASAANLTTVVGVYPSGANAIAATLSDPESKLPNYTLTQNLGTLTITQTTTVLTWANPAAITYGTALSAAQLDATSGGVAGTFVYAPPAGTILPVGVQTLSVTFTPTDGTDYSSAAVTASLTVNKAPLTVTPTPASKVYGTANPIFTGSITGLFAGDTITASYASAATTSTAVGVYSSGVNAISATLADPGSKLGNYTLTQNLGTLTVTQATTVLTWATPAAITYGTSLSATQLNATSGGVAGTFVYTPAAGVVLAAGSQTLSVIFTPTDTADYGSQIATVNLQVNKAALVVTPNPASRLYAIANPVFSGTITGMIAGDGISATYASGANATTPVGVYSAGANAIAPTLIDPGAKLGNYSVTQNLGTMTITQVTTSLTWATPAAITYGTALSGVQLDATSGGVAGTFVYSPAAGAVLSAGSHTLNVTFTPTDGADYSTATASVTLTVNPAVLTVTPTPSSKVYGTANPVFSGSITGMIPGDGITATYTSAATPTTIVGVYSSGPDAIAATLSDPGAKLGNYTLNQTAGALTITQATTVLTWATPASISYETALSATQLNATSGGVIGTYLYTPAAGVTLTAGIHTLSVAFTPSDAVDYSSASATVSLTVNKVTPTVLLTSSANPTVYGGSVTFTAPTAASATGTMTFYDGAASIGTGMLSGGVATFTVNSLGAGTHSITASYAGDPNYLSAVSAAESQVITRAPVTITVTSSLNPSSFGQSVTFTFTVAGVSGLATPTGTIAFSDGSTALASPTLNASGVATYTTVMLSGGSHTLSAVYGGDANYQ